MSNLFVCKLSVAESPAFGESHYAPNATEKAAEAGASASTDFDRSESCSEEFTPDAQAGVRNIEAITTVWSRNHLIAAYIMIWIITFVDSIQQGATFALTPYVTSSFEKHSLTAYTQIMSSIIGGVLKLPLAKILDIFGRPHGFALMTAFLLVGLTLMAVCTEVQMYSVAQIFYWIGYNGMNYSLLIFIADTSSLRNRAFMLAYQNSPYIITAWMTGPIAQALLHGPGWRWSFGIFAFMTIVAVAPLLALFVYNYRKAVQLGVIVPRKSDLTFSEACGYYAVEFDIGGLLLLMAGLVFFLLPFSLYSYQPGQWASPLVISFLIIGCLLLVGFALYEKYIAPKTFMPFELLTDRTVLGACVLSSIIFMSYFIWNAYFSSFLQVVAGLNLTQTMPIINIYNVGSCFWSLVVGVLINKTGRFKWVALYVGVPLGLLGVGLMIHFRHAGANVGYIIMCQIFIAFAGGSFFIAEHIAVMAATSHQYVAVAIAVEGMFANIGGAIGSSIAAALWTGVFHEKLSEFLSTEEGRRNSEKIYGDLTAQLSYNDGSPVRIAINEAYGDAQKWMCVCATAVLALSIPAILVWRDLETKTFKQTKGRVA